jgi:hypothetical protein
MPIRDGSRAQEYKSINGEADIEDATGGKGTSEVRMTSEKERKMDCSKVVGQRAMTYSEEVAEGSGNP